MWRNFGLAIAVLLAAAAAGIWLIFANIDGYILGSIESNGSAAANTQVTVRSVALSLLSGQCVISGLTVANPPGFSTPYALALGNISIQARPAAVLRSLVGGGPIVIDQVIIDRPHIFYEVRGGAKALSLGSLNLGSTSNLGRLQREASSSPGGPSRKEIIKELYVTHGGISISAPLLLGRQLTETLPEIHLSGIGEASGGATAAQAGKEVLDSISDEAALAGAEALVKAIGSAATGPFGGALANKLRSLF